MKNMEIIGNYKGVSACVVLINQEGLVLGVSRKDNHSDFNLIGGKMDPEDEKDIFKTAIRECKEETGLDITNLQLVFAIHKSKNMCFTFIADYSGEINVTENHVVKWIPFEVLLNGTYRHYNKLVKDSLVDMGILFKEHIDLVSMSNDVEKFVYEYFEGEIKFNAVVYNDYFKSYEVYFKEGEDDDFDEAFPAPPKFEEGLNEIGNKYGVRIMLTSDYWPK